MTAAQLEFLRARLAEDEQAARAAAWDEDLAAKWHVETSSYDTRGRRVRWYIEDAFDDGVVTFVDPQGSDDEAVARHIARHDPARILAEVDVKRRLLAIHRRYVDEPGQACLGCAGGIEWEVCPVAPLLALPYSDHPDFCEEWKL